MKKVQEIERRLRAAIQARGDIPLHTGNMNVCHRNGRWERRYQKYGCCPLGLLLICEQPPAVWSATGFDDAYRSAEWALGVSREDMSALYFAYDDVTDCSVSGPFADVGHRLAADFPAGPG